MPGNILEATKFRYNVYPIQHKKTFDLYKQAVACFWTVEELDFAKDKSDFEKLAPQQQEFILRVLSFFAVSDALVMQNCMSFQAQVQWPEAELFFAQQSMMEAIHQETYGLMLETLSPSPQRQEELVTAWLPTAPSRPSWSGCSGGWLMPPATATGSRMESGFCAESPRGWRAKAFFSPSVLPRSFI